MGQRTRKLTTMHNNLHPKDDVDRNEGRRELARIQDSIDILIQKLEEYIKMIKKTDYNHQKQYRQHKPRQNENNQKKNDCMDITRDKQVKYHMRKLGYGSERETLREKLNLF